MQRLQRGPCCPPIRQSHLSVDVGPVGGITTAFCSGKLVCCGEVLAAITKGGPIMTLI